MSLELQQIVENALARRIFPGAAVFLARGERVFAHSAFGSTAYEAEYSTPVTTQTVYDLASLTKLFTTTAWLIAARTAGVPAQKEVSHFLPEFQTGDKRDIQIRHLMQHASGIEIAIQSLVDASPATWLLSIAQAPLHSSPGERVLYSCTNMFLLARIFEKVAGVPLDEFIQSRILTPLEMNSTTFYPNKSMLEGLIAPSEIIDGELLCGVVHDEAARAWQEYSGHASCGNSGLFGTAEDVAKFCRLWCGNDALEQRLSLDREDIEQSLCDTIPEQSPAALRGWGWQIDARFYMSELAPPRSCGHAGFTGPTLWLSRTTQDVCVILNNRVYPNRNGPERFPAHRKIARWLLQQKMDG